MAGVTGLEPAASGVTGQRSNQLSYTPVEPDRLRDDLTAVKKPARAATTVARPIAPNRRRTSPV